MKKCFLIILLGCLVITSCGEDDDTSSFLEGIVVYNENCAQYVLRSASLETDESFLTPSNLNDSLKTDSVFVNFSFFQIADTTQCNFGPVPLIEISNLELADPCGKKTELNADKYASRVTDNYTILEAVLINNCIRVKVSSSGCDGSSWEAGMVDSESVMESMPVQRNIRFYLDNNEECDAVIQKSFYFDLSPIQTSDSEILINLQNWNQQLRYRY